MHHREKSLLCNITYICFITLSSSQRKMKCLPCFRQKMYTDQDRCTKSFHNNHSSSVNCSNCSGSQTSSVAHLPKFIYKSKFKAV